MGGTEKKQRTSLVFRDAPCKNGNRGVVCLRRWRNEECLRESRKLGDDEIRNNRKKKGYNICCICVDNALVLRSVNVAEIERKVDRVRRALVAYGLVTPGMVAVKDLTDLLGDLRHYCDFIGKDFAAFDKNAHQQYLDEKGPIKFG